MNKRIILLLLASLLGTLPVVAQGGIQFVYEEVGGKKVQKGIKYDGKIFRSQAELYQYQEAQMFGKNGPRGKSRNRGSGRKKGADLGSFEREYMKQVREQEERMRKAEEEAQNFANSSRQQLNSVVSEASYNQHVGTELMLDRAEASVDRRRAEIERGGYTISRPKGSSAKPRSSTLNRSRMLQALNNSIGESAKNSSNYQDNHSIRICDYPENNNILDVYAKETAQRATDKTAIYVQRQRSINENDTTEVVNIALNFVLPETEMIPVEPADKFSEQERIDLHRQYEADSAIMRKKMHTLIMLNDMVSCMDEELGINMVDATRDIWKFMAGVESDMFMDEVDEMIGFSETVKWRALSEIEGYALGKRLNDGLDEYFAEIKRKNFLSEEQVENRAYEVISQARDISSFAEKAGKIAGVVGKKAPVFMVLMHVPELGRSVGSGVASINIYFQRKKIIEQRKVLLSEISELDERMNDNIRKLYSHE